MNKLMVPPAPGTQDGDWIWDGTRWVCKPDCGPPCPPDVSVIQPGRPSPFYPPPVTQPPWYPGANGGVSFSGPGNPPPNPIRGAFWFDGTQLWLFDGAAWTGVGGVTAPSGGAGTAVGSTPPSNPQIGALWWDGNALLVWDGVKWDVAGGGTSTGSTPPANPQPGQQWFNGSTLYIWDGNAWVPTSQTQVFIQATAPPSPQPGDQWWDGTQMRIWDGSQWELVGPGATVGPVPTTTQTFSMVSADIDGVSTNTGGAWTIVPFVSVPAIDPQSSYNSTTQRITPAVAGNYLWVIRGWKGGAQSGVGGALVKNDNGTFSGLTPSGATIAVFNDVTAAGTGAFQQVAGMAHMNGTTDFVRLWGAATPDGIYHTIPNVPVIEGWLLP